MIISKKSCVVLLSHSNQLSNHVARIVLAEKAVISEVEYIDQESPPEDFLTINPYNTLPVLIDRDLVLNEVNIIIDYLDERFPHPPLLPVYPVQRAKNRLMIYRIVQDWFSLYNQLDQKGAHLKGLDLIRDKLRSEVQKIDHLLAANEYFMSSDFTLLDCYIAPFLWRMPSVGIDVNDYSHILEYEKKVFDRPSYQASLSSDELDLRGYTLT